MPNDPRDWAPQPPRKSAVHKQEDRIRAELEGVDLGDFDIDRAFHEQRLARAGVYVRPTDTQALAGAFQAQGFADPWLMAKKAQGHVQ